MFLNKYTTCTRIMMYFTVQYILNSIDVPQFQTNF